MRIFFILFQHLISHHFKKSIKITNINSNNIIENYKGSIFIVMFYLEEVVLIFNYNFLNYLPKIYI
jgi:hypothetical protein